GRGLDGEARDRGIVSGGRIEREPVRPDRHRLRVVETRAGAARGGARDRDAGIRARGPRLALRGEAAAVGERAGRRIAHEVRDGVVLGRHDVDRAAVRTDGDPARLVEPGARAESRHASNLGARAGAWDGWRGAALELAREAVPI